MKFYDFLQAIKKCVPLEAQEGIFDQLCKKYSAQSNRHTSFSLAAIELLPEEINCLITLLSNNESEHDFLTLINMGTATTPEENVDPYLGVKDPRIEQAIIEAAKAKQGNAAQSNKSVAVFGLSGNPPTLNHLAMIQHLCDQPEYDEVIPVLNAQSPLKAKDSYVESHHRYHMLQNMLEEAELDRSRYHLSRLEVDRLPPSRMVVTLSAMILLSEQPLNLSLMLGRDALSLKNGRPNFSYWYKWEDFAQLCHLTFYPRDGEELAVNDMAIAINTLKAAGIKCSLIFKDETTKNHYQAELSSLIPDLSDDVIFDVKSVNTTQGSATDIRAHYAAGRSGIPEGMAACNDAYVRRHGLLENDYACSSSHDESTRMSSSKP